VRPIFYTHRKGGGERKRERNFFFLLFWNESGDVALSKSSLITFASVPFSPHFLKTHAQAVDMLFVCNTTS